MIIELNIALIPNEITASKLIETSGLVAEKYSTIVQLEQPFKLSLAPHLTLYQLALDITQLEAAGRTLFEIASHTEAFTLAATRYAYNAGEASFELQRETTESLIHLQTEVLDALNPLRGDRLPMRDPSGATIANLLHADEPLGANIRDYGYAEVGPLFRPHDTLSWIKLDSTTDVDMSSLPDPQSLPGEYNAIGIFALGPHGTCPQLLAEYKLSARGARL